MRVLMLCSCAGEADVVQRQAMCRTAACAFGRSASGAQTPDAASALRPQGRGISRLLHLKRMAAAAAALGSSAEADRKGQEM
jgi:hypothetical protein